MSNTGSVDRVNASELKKEVNWNVQTEVISDNRFAAKGDNSTDL